MLGVLVAPRGERRHPGYPEQQWAAGVDPLSSATMASFCQTKLIGCIAFNFCCKAGFEYLISSHISEHFSAIVLQQTCKKWWCKILSVLGWESFSSIKVNHLIPASITARCEPCCLKARTDDHAHRSHTSDHFKHFTYIGRCRLDSTQHMKLVPP